jgi:hypothetical protein
MNPAPGWFPDPSGQPGRADFTPEWFRKARQDRPRFEAINE